MNNNVTLKMIMEALQDFCCYYDDAELLKRVLNEVCSGHAARDLEAIMEKNKNKYKHLQNASQLKRLVSEINAKAGMTVWTTETMKALGDSFRKHGIKTKRVTQERFLSQEESEKALYSCCETVMEQYKKALNQTRSSSKRPPRYMTEDYKREINHERLYEVPDNLFKGRVAHGNDLYNNYFSDFYIDRQLAEPYPYVEWRGNEKPGIEEYEEGISLDVEYTEWTPDLKSCIPRYSVKIQTVYDQARAIGFDPDTQIPMLCLRSVQLYGKSIGLEWKEKLKMTFGNVSYYDHKLYRQLLGDPVRIDTKDVQQFLNALKAGRDIEEIKAPLWGRCGGGIWIRSKDNYLMVSYRKPSGVTEIPDMLSYSSSGAFERFIPHYQGQGSPGKNMAKEIFEEVGVPIEYIPVEELTIISLGIDANRTLIQFSFFWDSPYSVDELIRFRLSARDSREQYAFFIPFEEKIINEFLESCEFEPGAAFSLMRLCQKKLVNSKK